MSDGDKAAYSVQQAILAQHSARHMKGPKMTLPNGHIISQMPYLGFRHPGEQVSLMLGDPTTILKKDYIRPGAQYGWLARTDKRTVAALRSKRARAVGMEEVDDTNPDAEVIEIKTPTGNGVVWENMLLVEFSERAVKKTRDYERYAISQLTTHIEAFGPGVEEATQGAYKGTFEVKDPQQGR